MRYLYIFLILNALGVADVWAQTADEIMQNEMMPAEENAVENSADNISEKQLRHLNFSPELVKAMTDCTAYQEDFTANNPELSKENAEGNTQQITVRVIGWDKDECHFTVEYTHKKGEQTEPQGKRTDCKLIKENLNELVAAMQDKSNDLYTDTIENQTVQGAQKQEITGSRFDVTYAKMKALLCQEETFDVTLKEPEQEEETEEQLTPEEFAERYNLFSPEFMLSLQACRPDSEERTIARFSHEIEIIGKENNICHVTYDMYDLEIPLDVVPNIHGFDDVKTLLKNEEIASFNYKPEYIYDGLVHAYNACRNKHSYYGLKDLKRVSDVVVSRSMNAEYDGKACIINLNNDVEHEGQITDYGVMCRLTDKTIEDLWPIFEDILNKYGEHKEIGADGKTEIVHGINNKKTKEADIALMFYMQQQGYCRKPEIK
ncbi:MAG: hypothetical protein IJ778_00025 [Alphaproteobacteria bacterium]|nr:hypothetical protein [Alphaproteobacteria bacterium]